MPPTHATTDSSRYCGVRKNNSKRNHNARWNAANRMTASTATDSNCFAGRGRFTKIRLNA
ncbi:hypothetical protein D3C71_1895040 [compost metagenome]